MRRPREALGGLEACLGCERTGLVARGLGDTSEGFEDACVPWWLGVRPSRFRPAGALDLYLGPTRQWGIGVRWCQGYMVDYVL